MVKKKKKKACVCVFVLEIYHYNQLFPHLI